MLNTSDKSAEYLLETNYNLNNDHICLECLNTTNHNQSHYDNFTFEALCEFGSDENLISYIFKTFVFIMYTVVFIVALLGNGLVCFVVHSTPRMRTVTNYFIVNLAIGDILMTLFCVPFTFVSQLILWYWPFGMVMCKIVNFSQAVSVLVSAYTLLAISVDRYIVIMQPFRPRLCKTTAKLVVFTVWMGAIITAVPIPVVSELQRPSTWHELCEVDMCLEQWETSKQLREYTIALVVLQFALPLSVLVCTYVCIAHTVWRVRPPGESQDSRDSRLHHSKRKMVKMMVTVVFVFTICWLPLNIFIVVWSIHGDDEEWSSWPGLNYIWFGCHWLAMSHSCYNPIIYGYMNTQYRLGFQQIFDGLSLLLVKKSKKSFQHPDLCETIPLPELAAVDNPAK